MARITPPYSSNTIARHSSEDDPLILVVCSGE